jgi:hypothetical protein
MGELHSMAASSHPSHCEWEIGEEAKSHSWAGQSRRRGNRATVTASVGVPQHQRSTNVVVTPPPVANVAAQQRQRTASVAMPPPPRPTADATMHVARQLLNNPPPTGASSSTVEQWCHDVDQLLVVAINTPPPGGNHQIPDEHSLTPTSAHVPPAPGVPSSMCPPSVARAPSTARAPGAPRVLIESVATSDLRNELLHRQGEDSHITIERRRERRHHIEARNLEKDVGSLAPTREPAPHAVQSPGSPATSGGCMVLAPHLRMVIW